MAETPKKKDVLQDTDDAARRQAKGLMRLARHGALAVLEPETGHPMSSRVAVVCDLDGTPVMLASSLSGHSAGLAADPRCSLLLGEPGKGDPLAHPRITLLCRARKLERETGEHARLRRRYLARHPKAELYVDFPDFAFYRLEIERASLNGGFGKAFAPTREDLVLPEASWTRLESFEAGAVAHMNEDHADAVKLYAEVLCKAGEGSWRLAGLDPEGLDLQAGDQSARLWFDTPLEHPGDLRAALVDLAGKARATPVTSG
ncbi:HugZ family pyridoxamine 5'-phosphate oxidase [Pannonibacter tanglangensis]|uniref:DUF2470 domain-containing protein n=1 Tax=Pannonibacter tanglangensis TaxID=2750084 RepID=A0ABW9ZET7_9HYPH|nr:HugZ family protein [Pannonibacter sp. XCT-34]NBN63349.1 DUF2470 domain-containing protein [Pannonibacter sp. XCT-34]